MKHILNDISQEEKNSILEKHTGGKHLMIENFNNLVNNKLGTVKTLISEDDMTVGGPITDKIEECAQDVFGPGILPKIPTCVWLAQYHLSTKKDHFDKNDKYDKVKVPACRRELEKAESTGAYYGAVYGYTDFMNCIFNCISCFGRQDVANF